MYKLLNMSDFSTNEELEKDMEYYMKKYSFDGFEFIKFTQKDNLVLKEYIKGYHMRFFPSWLDLYRERYDKLYEELKEEKYVKSLCGGLSKAELVDYYKNELEIAKKLEVEYIVFHPCNVYISESMSYKFIYSDEEVLHGVVNLLNEIFTQGEYKFTLLLENLWWSGLKLDSYEQVDYLIKNLKYKNVGFMLDTGHMLNNNRELKNSQEGLKYIKKNLENLKEYRDYIYGMHLNYSMSGEYVKNFIAKHDESENFDSVMEKVYPHVFAIDGHYAFEDEGIIELIGSLPYLRYLTYEFIAWDKKSLEEKIEKQEKVFRKN